MTVASSVVVLSPGGRRDVCRVSWLGVAVAGSCQRCWPPFVGEYYLYVCVPSRFPALVTKRRRNSGDRCNSGSNSRKPQKAHSKTDSRPTGSDQHRTEAHEPGLKQPATARSTQHAPETQHHTAPNSPKCNRKKSMRPHPAPVSGCLCMPSQCVSL